MFTHNKLLQVKKSFNSFIIFRSVQIVFCDDDFCIHHEQFDSGSSREKLLVKSWFCLEWALCVDLIKRYVTKTGWPIHLQYFKSITVSPYF